MIDLHTHSTASDGSESPARLVELAVERGCSAIALTDHDGLGGLEEAERAAASVGIDLVRGCEVSCTFEPGSLHVLCYFVDGDGLLAERLAGLRDDRERRNVLLLARLAELGLPVGEEELRAEAGSEVVGRPHVAAILVRKGIVGSVREAFDRYLAKGRRAYVERERIELEEIVDLAETSGAITVVAHPMSLELDAEGLERAVRDFADLGVAGLECLYSEYNPALRTDLTALARRHALIPTGGSDFHGSYKPGLELGTGRGDLKVPDEVLLELRERGGR